MKEMELNLKSFYDIAENIEFEEGKLIVRDKSGAGAAGGLGAASELFLTGQLTKGKRNKFNF